MTLCQIWLTFGHHFPNLPKIGKSLTKFDKSYRFDTFNCQISKGLANYWPILSYPNFALKTVSFPPYPQPEARNPAPSLPRDCERSAAR